MTRKRPAAPSPGVFAGLSFCVSGSFSVSQAALKRSIVQHGGATTSSVTAATDYLVCDSAGGTKFAEAQRKGAPVVSEQWLQQSIDTSTLSDDTALFLSQPDTAASKPNETGRGGRAAANRKRSGEDEEGEEGGEEGEEREGQNDAEEEKVAEESQAAVVDKADNKRRAGKGKRKTRAEDEEKEESEAEEEKEEEEEEEEEEDVAAPAAKRLKTVLVKGRAPVDDCCPVAAQCHVLDDASGVYDAALNQTSIGANANKFYLIQALQADSGSPYYCWTRWGRVGDRGQSSLQQCASADAAKAQFAAKFRDKTKNAWSDRDNFQAAAGKYTLLERDYSAAEADGAGDEVGEGLDEAKRAQADATEKKQKQSKLDARVQELVSLICDVSQRTTSHVNTEPIRVALHPASAADNPRGETVCAAVCVCGVRCGRHDESTACGDRSATQAGTQPHSVNCLAPPALLASLFTLRQHRS